MIGANIGPYRVLELLGRGGMGEVWLAEDTRLGRRVALKRLDPGRGLGAGEWTRVRREARAVARLSHPNVAVLYDLCEIVHPPLLVMELIEGHTLADRLRSGPLAVAEAVRVGGEIVDAIAHAHARGVVHRDIKPSNVMLTKDARVKVLDFGLARVGALVDPQAGEDATIALTQGDALAGTLPYMAPEQVRGTGADERSDVFALGVVLFEMFAGRLPHLGATRAELASAILRDPAPALDVVRRDLSGDLVGVVARCLQKDPADRFSGAGSLAEAWARLGSGHLEADATVAAPVAVGQVRPSGAHRFAVLGFDNLTGDAASDWLSEGIAETVAADLRKVSGIDVVTSERIIAAVAGLSSGEAKDAVGLGRLLGVGHLVRGAFQRAGDRIRITASLLDVTTGRVSASVKIDGAMDQIFELQDRVIRALLEDSSFVLEHSDLARIARPQTRAVGAYELYARARTHILRMGAAGFDEARTLLLQALDLDPDYALVHTAIGQMLAMRYIVTTDPRDLAEAFTHLDRAIALDPELGEPWTWKAYGLARLQRFTEAIDAGHRAIAAAGADAQSHYFTATAHWLRAAVSPVAGDLEAVVAAAERALRFDPSHQPALMLLCDVEHRRGKDDAARAAARSAVELELGGRSSRARFVGSHAQLGLLDLHAGDLRSARANLSTSLERLGASDQIYVPHLRALTHLGLARVASAQEDHVTALATIEAAHEEARTHPRAVGMGRVLARLAFARAEFAALTGHRTAALAHLRRAEEFEAAREGYDFTGLWASMDMDIHVDHARASEALGLGKEAAAARERARAAGWTGHSW